MLGLRALAALSIIGYHTWLYSSPGGPVELPEPIMGLFAYSNAGVSIFMLLSAFLLYTPVVTAILAGQPLPPIRRYLHRRIVRLFPAYWLILLAVSVILGVALIRVGGQLTTGSFTDHPELLLVNMLLLQNFWPTTFLSGIGPAWFVSTVFVFYLLLPLLAAAAALLAARARSTRGKVIAVMAPAVALIVLGITAKVFAELTAPPGPTPGWDANWSSVIARGLPGQADRFGYGMVAAVAASAIYLLRAQLPARWWVVLLLSGISVVGVTLAAHRLALIDELVLESGLTIGFGLIFMIVVLQDHLPGRGRSVLRVLDNRYLSAIGVISYGAFLWNEPIIRWLNSHGITRAGPLGLMVNLALVVVVVLTLAAATYFIAERRFISASSWARSSAAAAQSPPS